MVAGVVTVGGKRYAVGLYWQVSDLPNAAKAAKTAAKQPGSSADFYCIRQGSARGRAPQFGLGEQKLGHAWNMPSAAASLANRQPGSWAGVFIVPEGVWFVEVRDDLIAPEGDQIFADEAEAMNRLQEASALGGLEKIYAPASWAIPGAEGSSLPSLLSGRADAKLQPVTLPPIVYKIAAGAVVGCGVLLVIVLFVMHLQSQAEEDRMIQESQARAAQMRAEEDKRRQEEEARRQQDEIARQREMEQQILNAPQYQRVWEQTPKPLAWLSACRDAMDKVQVSPMGWTLSSVSCSGNQVTASWSRGTGPAIVPPGAQVDSSMHSASGSFPLADVAPRGAEQLWPSDAIMLYTLHNDWLAQLDYVADDPTPTLPNGQSLPPPPWVKRTVSWSVPLSPWTLKGPLVDLPGFVIQTLTWSQDGSWKLEGVLYEQRK